MIYHCPVDCKYAEWGPWLGNCASCCGGNPPKRSCDQARGSKLLYIDTVVPFT